MKFIGMVLAVIGVIGLVAVISLVFNFIPAGIAYLIIVKALGISLTFWKVYWGTFLLSFLGNLLFRSGASAKSK